MKSSEVIINQNETAQDNTAQKIEHCSLFPESYQTIEPYDCSEQNCLIIYDKCVTSQESREHKEHCRVLLLCVRLTLS